MADTIPDRETRATDRLPVVRPPFREKPLRKHPNAPVPEHWQDAGELGTADDPAFGPL